MSSELPNPPDEPADRPAAQALPPPPLPGQAEAADWTPQDWRPPPSAPATTEVAAGTDPEQIPSYGSAPQAKPPLDTVSLIALITAIPSLGLVSIPLGIWGVIRTKNKQRRGRTLAVISFVLIGLWAIVGTVVGVMVGLPTTVKTAAPAPSGLVAPATVSPAPATVSPTPVAPSKTKIPGRQPHGPLRKAKKVYWDQLKTGDCFKGWSEKGSTVITRVDCRSPHEEEVTGTFNLRAAVAIRATRRSTKPETPAARSTSLAMSASTGTPRRTTTTTRHRTVRSWRYGDRLVICVADDPNHPKGNRISLRKVKQ